MSRPFFLFLAFLVASIPVSGQVASTDSQTLQALIAEVRLLRQDLQMLAANNLRAQILLQRLRDQEAVVERVKERVDNGHVQLTSLQAQRNRDAAYLKQNEDLVSETDTSSVKRKEIENRLAVGKQQLEELMSDEQQLQARIIEEEGQQRLEQAKLDSLHDQLDRLLQSLDKGQRPHTRTLVQPPKSRSRETDGASI